MCLPPPAQVPSSDPAPNTEADGLDDGTARREPWRGGIAHEHFAAAGRDNLLHGALGIVALVHTRGPAARPEARPQVQAAAGILGLTAVQFMDLDLGDVRSTAETKPPFVRLVRAWRPALAILQDPVHAWGDLDPGRARRPGRAGVGSRGQPRGGKTRRAVPPKIARRSASLRAAKCSRGSRSARPYPSRLLTRLWSLPHIRRCGPKAS